METLSDEELRSRSDLGREISLMRETAGWKSLEALLLEQLNAYVASNATEARDWDDYRDKAGKIFGIRLLLTDTEDFVRMGLEADEELRKR